MLDRKRMKWAAHRHATACLSIALLWSSQAEAHVGTQFVPLLAGALHPWLTPACAMVLIALVLWLCQHVQSTDLAPFGMLSACLTAGVGVGLSAPVSLPPWGTGLLALTLASCVSVAVRPRRPLWLGIVSASALLAGVVAGADAARDVSSPILFLAGIMAGSLVVPLTVALVLVDRPWSFVKVAVRIGGSWVAAIALIGMAL
jgi:hypothetical protein